MNTMRLVTANLFNRHVDPAALEQFIDAAKPDVMLVQELAPHASHIVGARLRYGLLDPRDDYEGRGIALDRPGIVEPLMFADRSAWVATLEPQDWPMLTEPLEIVCMHLVSPIDPPPWRSVRMRSHQLNGLEDHLAARPGVRRIVAGDMNATPAWPAYRRLASLLTDGIAEAGASRRTWGPFWWSPRLLRIDHVFVSGVRVLQSQVRTIRGSDHSAVVVDLAV